MNQFSSVRRRHLRPLAILAAGLLLSSRLVATTIPLGGAEWTHKDNVRAEMVDDPVKGQVFSITGDFSKITYAWSQCKLPKGALAKDGVNGFRLVWKSYRERKQDLTLKWMENGLEISVSVSVPVGPEWREVFIPFRTIERALSPIAKADLGKIDTLMIHFGPPVNQGDACMVIASLAVEAGPEVTADYPEKPKATAAHVRDLPILKARITADLIPELFIPTNEAPAALALLASMGPEGGWSDVKYDDRSYLNWNPVRHVDRLATMAIAWARLKVGGFDGAKLDELRGGIRRGLLHWGKEDPQCERHWWQNKIGNNLFLAKVALALDGTLDPAEREVLNRLLIRGEPGGFTGGNLTWTLSLQMARAILMRDPEVMMKAFDLAVEDLHVAPANEEGLKIDLSFHQHAQQLYSGGYGSGWLMDATKYVSQTLGTAYQVPLDKLDLLTRALLDGYRFMIWNGDFDYSTRGREVNRPAAKEKFQNRLTLTAARLSAFPGPRQAEVLQFSRELSNLQNHLSGNRQFWKSDYMVHRRTEWMVSVKMLSPRTVSGELVNGEGLKAHHLSSGLSYLYQGSETGYEDIFPVWDWKRLPGTTLPWSPDPPAGDVSSRGETELAGGASDGRLGATAFHFKYKGVEARKSWFFFDGEAIALGSGIRGGEDPMQTTLDQSLWTGEVQVGEGDGERVVRGSLEFPKPPAWVHHRGFGFVPLCGVPLGLEAQARTGSWKSISTSKSADPVSKPVVTLWFDHGSQVRNGTYGYAVVPGDVATTRSWSRKKPVTILAQTASVMAVEREAEGIAMASFYGPATVPTKNGLTLSAEGPAVVLLKRKGTALEIRAAHPSCKDGTMTLTLSGKWSGPGASADPAGKGTVLRIPLPTGDMAGSTVTVNLTAL